MRRVAPIAAAGAACLLAALSGCGASVTGVRREGPGPSPTVRPAREPLPAVASNRAALAALVRGDAAVSASVRRDLVPCSSHGSSGSASRALGARSGTGTTSSAASSSAATPAATEDYPVDADSGELTSGDGPDLLVTVSTCGDGVGIAAYVYRLSGGAYHCVFADERPPVYGSLDSDRLRIIHQVYRTDDQLAYPAGEDEALYAWRSGHFVEVARSYSDLTAKTPTPSPEPTSARPVPVPTPAAPYPPAGTSTSALPDPGTARAAVPPVEPTARPTAQPSPLPIAQPSATAAAGSATARR
ncbi:hypothetical protein [Actinacidiphila yeochonensis]|uniref:hypothetical protein n=1 Tax=Actinacidiphila yeochonensis TaxID=89050 RepID=UPI00068FBDEA|nr:hypothetical protein [Actinacidiphila yeochonensis]